MGLLLGSAIAGAGAGANKYLDMEEQRRRDEQQQADRMMALEKESELRDASKEKDREAEQKAILDGVNRMKEAVGQLPPEEQKKLREDPMAFGRWAIENGFPKEGEAFVKAGYYKTLSDLQAEKENSERARQLKAQADALKATIGTMTGARSGTGSRSGGIIKGDQNAYSEDDFKVIRESEAHSTAQKAQAEALARRTNDKSMVNPHRALLAAERGEQVTMGTPSFQPDSAAMRGAGAGPGDQGDAIVAQEQLGVPGAPEQQRLRERGLVTGNAMEQYIQQRVGQFRQGGAMPSETELGAMAAQRLAGDKPAAPAAGDPIESLRARFRPAGATPSTAPGQTASKAEAAASSDPLAGLSQEEARKMAKELRREMERYEGHPAAAARIAETRKLLDRLERQNF